MIDEGERQRRYPGLGFRGPEWGRRAWVLGTSLDVWQIIRALQDFGGDADRMARESAVSARHIALAAGYYREFRDEIDEAIAVDRRPLGQLEREYPFIQPLTFEQ